MENRVLRNKTFLKSILKAKTKSQRRKLVKKATNDEINSICELCFNLQRLNSKTYPKVSESLKKYRPSLKTLLKKRVPIKIKRQLIVQKGGFLPFLAPIAGTLISSLVSKWLKK